MPTVRDILAEKEPMVLTVNPETDVLQAVRKMNTHRVGAMVVVEEGRVVGMFTERDVLRLVGAMQDVSSIRVGDVMSRTVISTTQDADLDEVSEMMRSHRVRHVPVLCPMKSLIGLVSIGDLNAWCVSHQARQLEGLNEYIYGRA